MDAVVQTWKFGTSGYHGYAMEPQTTQYRPTLLGYNVLKHRKKYAKALNQTQL